MKLPMNRFVVGSAASAILAIGCSAGPTEPSATASAAPPASTASPIPGVPAALTQAIAAGLSPTQLAERGWTCRVPPPTPDRIVCSHPNQELPSPFTPVAERPVVFTVLVFDSSTGAFLGTQIGMREDRYNGQVCKSTGAQYIYRPAIGYYECLHTVGG
jgi:hypothetical protein